MERLHVGDIVRVKRPNSKDIEIGIITTLAKHNNDSIDGYEYSISKDIEEWQIEAADAEQKHLPSAVYLSNESFWFKRQELELLEKSKIRKYHDNENKKIAILEIVKEYQVDVFSLICSSNEEEYIDLCCNTYCRWNRLGEVNFRLLKSYFGGK